jgi:hypothetical protein
MGGPEVDDRAGPFLGTDSEQMGLALQLAPEALFLGFHHFIELHDRYWLVLAVAIARTVIPELTVGPIAPARERAGFARSAHGIPSTAHTYDARQSRHPPWKIL